MTTHHTSGHDTVQHLELVGSFGKRRIAKAISEDDEVAFLEGEINSFLQGLRGPDC